jgi:hypothetical protein
MNFRNKKSKYQEIQTTANKTGESNNELFSSQLY